MGRGRAPCCDKTKVKKGPWSPAEDATLTAFILNYGHSNWRTLPKQAGLLRCGKSCRLRWINYLRPDVKRGNFTPEEEQTIINLHNSLGNKWSKIASHLAGRTDNEIKNVWNTHLKKRVATKTTQPKTTYSSASPSTATMSAADDSPTSSSSSSSSTSNSINRPGHNDNESLLDDDGKIEIPLEYYYDDDHTDEYYWELMFDSLEYCNYYSSNADDDLTSPEEKCDQTIEESSNSKWFRQLENHELLGLLTTTSDHGDMINYDVPTTTHHHHHHLPYDHEESSMHLDPEIIDPAGLIMDSFPVWPSSPHQNDLGIIYNLFKSAD